MFRLLLVLTIWSDLLPPRLAIGEYEVGFETLQACESYAGDHAAEIAEAVGTAMVEPVGWISHHEAVCVEDLDSAPA